MKIVHTTARPSLSAGLLLLVACCLINGLGCRALEPSRSSKSSAGGPAIASAATSQPAITSLPAATSQPATLSDATLPTQHLTRPNWAAPVRPASTVMAATRGQRIPPVVTSDYQSLSQVPVDSVVQSGPPGSTQTAVQQAGWKTHSAGCQCGAHSSSTGEYRPLSPTMNMDPVLNYDGSCIDTTPCPAPMIYGPMGGMISPQYRDPQEYIFDGGDQLPSTVRFKDGSLDGLSPEDTVMVYETESGVQGVEPACRAAIYAPRFAAVRKITRLTTEDFAIGPQATRRNQITGSIDEQLPTLAITKPIAMKTDQSLTVVEGFRDRNRGVPVRGMLPAITMSDSLMPYEDLQLIRTGIQDESEGPQLARSAAAALAWSSFENVMVIIDGQAAELSASVAGTQETVVYELNGKSRVEICKVASHQLAEPGDEVSFTIRFDNVGEQPVQNITIVDSLPARLTYLDNSQQASVEADFATQANEVGSEVLRWEIAGQLKPGEGGVIRFRCQVR